VVALSVPIVLAEVFTIMQMMGLNFDRITVGALITALGLLVDDAIIAVKMMVVKIEQGYNRVAAAFAAWSSTAFPMLTGTLVTAAGFLPVGLAQSTSLEYAGNIFWVMGIALIVSWFVAVIVTPHLGLKLLPVPKPGVHHGSSDSRVYRMLRAGVNASLRARWLVIGLTLAALVTTGVGMGLEQQRFFPTSARADRIVFGPPVGFPVQFRVIGPDPAEVRRIAADVRAVMVANPNTVEPQFDWNEQATTLNLRLDQDRIRAPGLSTADVSNTLQTLLSGAKVTEYRDGTAR